MSFSTLTPQNGAPYRRLDLLLHEDQSPAASQDASRPRKGVSLPASQARATKISLQFEGIELSVSSPSVSVPGYLKRFGTQDPEGVPVREREDCRIRPALELKYEMNTLLKWHDRKSLT